MAVNGGHKGLVAYLLREGVNLELKDYKGWTALHCAAWQGNVKIARTLIQSGADVNCRNSDLETPLLLAVRYKRIFILDELFHHRVDFTVTDSSGCSAMDLAIQAGEANTVSSLIGNGQKILWSDRRTCSPLCLSLKSESYYLSLFLLDFAKDYTPECDRCGSLLVKAF